MSQFSRERLSLVTAITMATATFPQVVFGVLAAELIFEFTVDRWQVGALVTATGVAGALVAPVLGRFTDQAGALRSTRGVLYSSLGTLGLIALSPTYFLVALSSLLSGVPQGWSNSATNLLIAESLPQGQRGIVTGIKQSGVQAGIFLGGLLLPVFSTLWGWRLAVVVFLLIPLSGILATLGKTNVQRVAPTQSQTRLPIPSAIRWVTIYGVLSGLGTSAMLTFLPLFAEEGQSWSSLHAGWLLAGVGLVGIGARITWGRVSESWLGHGRTLEVLAFLTVISSLLLALASSDWLPSWVLVVSGALVGIGAVSWNTVGMLAAMDHSPVEQVGRGTGVILLGFLLGFGLGAPLMGLSVDRLNSYTPGWLAVSLLFLVASLIARKIPEARSGSKASVPAS